MSFHTPSSVHPAERGKILHVDRSLSTKIIAQRSSHTARAHGRARLVISGEGRICRDKSLARYNHCSDASRHLSRLSGGRRTGAASAPDIGRGTSLSDVGGPDKLSGLPSRCRLFGKECLRAPPRDVGTSLEMSLDISVGYPGYPSIPQHAPSETREKHAVIKTL